MRSGHFSGFKSQIDACLGEVKTRTSSPYESLKDTEGRMSSCVKVARLTININTHTKHTYIRTDIHTDSQTDRLTYIYINKHKLI